MRPIRDIDDPRLVKALSHPLRVRIMGILEHRTATPKQLADAVGVNLENVAYHVRTLRDLGLIKLERRGRVGGAVEHYYKAVERPRVTAKAWERMPDISQRAMIGAALEQLGAIVSAAASEGRFSRPQSHVSRRPLVLDNEGFAEASKVLSWALDELLAVEKQAKKRIETGAEEVPTTAVTLLFDTPQAIGPEPRSRPSRRPHLARSSGS
ncbi:MAG: transcriptional regulator, ArsR family [Solirubrobacterales bacterium]|nr:transcriptional regulator, ArsR family [Solirubrobacterales bacterium]